MEELLQKLLEAEVLTDETRKESFTVPHLPNTWYCGTKHVDTTILHNLLKKFVVQSLFHPLKHVGIHSTILSAKLLKLTNYI